MQGGEIQNVLPSQITFPCTLLDANQTSNILASTTFHSEDVSTTVDDDVPPLVESRKCLSPNLAGIPPSGRLVGNLSKEVLAQQAILAKKLRLSKIISREAYYAAQVSQKNTLRDEDDLRGDIRVLSPSLVNSQVLPKTRPLSPEPLLPLKPEVQDENLNSPKLRWKEPGGRRKQEGIGRGGKEDDEAKNQEKEGTKGKGRGRRRPRIFKLKFHHQALPPEYLDHYEASLRQEQRQEAFYEAVEGIKETRSGPRETIKEGLQSGLRKDGKTRNNRNQRNSRPITIHEAGSGATEALLRDLLMANPHLQQAALQQAAIARAQSVPSIMLASIGSPQRLSYQHMTFQPPSPDSSVGGDDRLSYASDMSIDECPKKGRKPKKNDVSFLMGRGLSGTGLGNTTVDSQREKTSPMSAIDNSTDSFLSPLPSQFDKDQIARSKSYASLILSPAFSQNEPLNLCMRDESVNSTTVQAPYEVTDFESRVKTEPFSKEASKRIIDRKDSDDGCRDSRLYSPSPSAADYNAWSLGSGYAPQWVHDYRLKMEDGLSSGQSTPSICSQSSQFPCMSPPTWPHLSPPPTSQVSSPLSPPPPLSPLVHHPRHIQALIKESLQHKFEETSRERLSPRENLVTSSVRTADRRSPITKIHQRESPVKGGGARRKRSALFIPPADPSTEVSICKFKFTGGANPMLEEKKMVSVDAGGTLRYFSGGDRNFLRDPRNSPSTRLTGKLLENLSKCEKDVKKIRLESDTDDTCSLSGGCYEASCSSATMSPTGTLENDVHSPLNLPPPIEDSPKRKRRSKKSSVREKLEQTLREKGLLIQTQQVESAEGATYCKFRQLRKITRYLFRSWKDYLPGQMHDGVQSGMPTSRSPSEYPNSNLMHPPQMSAHNYKTSRH